jgi:hypothetical protein
MSFKKNFFFWIHEVFLGKNIIENNNNNSLELGSKSELEKKESLLSHDESKALWIKINQTLQIIH